MGHEALPQNERHTGEDELTEIAATMTTVSPPVFDRALGQRVALQQLMRNLRFFVKA